MRAVIITDFGLPNGGAPRVALESARGLAEAGVSVLFIHAVGTGGSKLLDHPAIERVGLGHPDVWDLPPARGALRGIWNAGAARRLRDLLARETARDTVIHLHQWTRAFSPSMFPIVARSRHPWAITMHDYFLACPNGVYYRFEEDRPCTLTPMSLGCVAARCDPRNSFVKAIRTVRTGLAGLSLKGRSFHVIHVSDRGRETISPFLPATVRHHQVDNPVDVHKRAPAQIPPESKIAFVGRLTREKGIDLVAAAAREAGLGLLVIGDGPLAGEVREIHPEAECLGWRSAAEVDVLLRTRVRAVVAPSLWYETGPLTVYEAMASGLPTVVSDRAGAAAKVTHGETGFVVKPELAAVVRALRDLADTSRARAMGRAAYERFWVEPPTLARHASSLVEVYRAMLGHASCAGDGAETD